jgi:hypothetical protein
MRTGQGHSQQAGQLAGYITHKSRLLRGHQNLKNARGEASTLKPAQNCVGIPAEFDAPVVQCGGRIFQHNGVSFDENYNALTERS